MPSTSAQRAGKKKRKYQDEPESKARAARSRKKSARVEETHSDSSDSEGPAEGEQELVDCDLEFYDPRPTDAGGLRDLLLSFLDGNAFDLSSLVDAIIKQVCVQQRPNLL